MWISQWDTLKNHRLNTRNVYATMSSGWWLGHPSEKYEFVSWDDEIPNIWEHRKWQPNHQPDVDAAILDWLVLGPPL